MSDDKQIKIAKPVLQKNDGYAAANRERFEKRGILAVNLISSPGSGKTTLLEAMAKRLGKRMAVIEGDLQTRRDAERMEQAGVPAYQIETGGACHLNAKTVGEAFDSLDAEDSCEILVIENVGNLVCPAAYDLGAHMKAAILSTPEGDDKVLKYPSIFCRIGALLINKTDLLPHLAFDMSKVEQECASLNADFQTFRISAKTGEGVDNFCEFLLEKRSAFTA